MYLDKRLRRDIVDAIHVAGFSWHGDLDEVKFLSRVYSLDELPSYDTRFPDAAGDIWQHRINNDDWDDDWVFSDNRLNLLDGPDEKFLLFLCEMVHPLVRPDPRQAAEIAGMVNEYLMPSGWAIAERVRIAGKPVFVPRKRLTAAVPLQGARTAAQAFDAGYVVQQITRMEAAIETDPELAIGTAKEFVETVCRTILRDEGLSLSPNEDFPKLVRLTLKQLRLVPDEIPDHVKTAQTIRLLLQNLATISNALAELRNPYGTGHGKPAGTLGLQPRHAHLAAGAASALGVFLFETYQQRAGASR